VHKCIFQTKPDRNIHNLINWTDQLDNDYNQDCVLIRESTRPVNLATQVTKLNIHSISNQEVVFTPTSVYHRFMTESTCDTRFVVTVHATAVNIKAATRAYVNT